MSTNATPSSHTEEMDLTDIFALFKRWFYQVLALGFKALDFIFKFWWVIVLLIIGGAALGYFTKGKPSYKSSVIIQTNFDSQPYVYNAIKQFDENLGEKDQAFFEKCGLNPEHPEIGGVELVPIIDVVGLTDVIENRDRALGTIIEELSVEEDTELFASDRFYSNYKFHTLNVDLPNEASKDKIQIVLDYINNQPYAVKLQTEGKKNLEDRIAKNDKTLEQIDLLIEKYADNADVASKMADKLSYFNNQNNINVNGVLTFKNELITETEALKNKLVNYDGVAVAISDIQTAKDTPLSSKKEILYPFFLVFFFLVFAAVRFTYKTLRKQLEEQNLLD